MTKVLNDNQNNDINKNSDDHNIIKRNNANIKIIIIIHLI